MDLTPDPTARAVVPVLACVLNQLVTKNNRVSFVWRNGWWERQPLFGDESALLRGSL